MSHPTTRVLTVLELLQTYRRLTGAELAARLEVAPRTLRRYITMLQDQGIPIEAERGRHGAYRLRPGFKLPPLIFTDDEALALTLGLLAVRQLGLAATAPAIEGALAKVERVLPPPVQARVQAVQQTVVLGLPTPIGTPASTVLSTLSMAAQQERCAWIRYRTWQNHESERVIDPYGLVYHGGRWFAVGYCHLRAGLRMFRMDRVLEAAPCDERFARPPNFDCLGYVVRSLATSPGTWSVEVLLKTTLEEAQQRVPPILATLEPAPNGVVLRCQVQRLPWFAHFLAGLEMPLVIRQPAELRAALRQLATYAQRLADADEQDSHE